MWKLSGIPIAMYYKKLSKNWTAMLHSKIKDRIGKLMLVVISNQGCFFSFHNTLICARNHKMFSLLYVLRSGRFQALWSPDVYGVSVSLLRAVAWPLAHVLDCYLNSGFFPAELKVAKTVPIYKKDDPPDVGSYCLISILSVFDKILEERLGSLLWGKWAFLSSSTWF